MPLLLLLFGGVAAVAAVAARRRWDIDVGEEGATLVVSGPQRRPTPRQTPFVVTPPATPSAPREPVGVVAKGKFTGRFGVRRSATHIHKGIDISAARGTPVRAINGGVVEGVYPDGARYGYGNSVLLKHPDGKRSFYAHLHMIAVAPGQHVAQGQTIGTVGATQKRIRGGQIQPNPRPHMPPHLHMEVQTNVVRDQRGNPIIGENVPGRMDPLAYMQQVGAKPVGIEVA